MRTLAAIVLALALAPVATAAKPPLPIRHDGIEIVRSAPLAKRHASCSAQSHANTKVARASRKLLPVACEQPPRVKLVGINGINPIFGP